MNHLAIFGASGHGRVIADAAALCGWKKISFFDDDETKNEQKLHWPFLGSFFKLLENIENFDGVIVGIGNNLIRHDKYIKISQKGGKIVSVIHPMAIISKYSSIGNGSVIFANSVVNAGAQIGDFVILNTASTIDHDCKIGDASHISPGANLAGGVIVGSKTWVGIGACIKQNIKIGENVVIGAGAVVVKDLPDNVLAIGNPAKIK